MKLITKTLTVAILSTFAATSAFAGADAASSAPKVAKGKKGKVDKDKTTKE